MKIDLNLNVKPKKEIPLIPEGTIAKVHIKVRPSMSGSLITKSKTTDAEYISMEATILEGDYILRKVFFNIGIKGKNPESKWDEMGQKLLRKILRSAYNITNSANSSSKLILKDYSELNGLKITIQIKIRPAEGEYKARNELDRVLTPEDKGYIVPSDTKAEELMKKIDDKLDDNDKGDDKGDDIPF